MTVLTVLAVLESALPSFSLSYKMKDEEATVAVLAVSAVMAVSVMTATPLKLNPPFSVILTFCEFWCLFNWESKHDSHSTFVPECPWEKFMN